MYLMKSAIAAAASAAEMLDANDVTVTSRLLVG